MTPSEQQHDELRRKLNLETSRMAWHELQTHFAAGIVVGVSGELDLIDVAAGIANDDKTAVTRWMAQQHLGQVTDTQAALWLAEEARLWVVVVKPWILVQREKNR